MPLRTWKFESMTSRLADTSKPTCQADPLKDDFLVLNCMVLQGRIREMWKEGKGSQNVITKLYKLVAFGPPWLCRTLSIEASYKLPTIAGWLVAASGQGGTKESKCQWEMAAQFPLPVVPEHSWFSAFGYAAHICPLPRPSWVGQANQSSSGDPGECWPTQRGQFRAVRLGEVKRPSFSRCRCIYTRICEGYMTSIINSTNMSCGKLLGEHFRHFSIWTCLQLSTYLTDKLVSLSSMSLQVTGSYDEKHLVSEAWLQKFDCDPPPFCCCFSVGLFKFKTNRIKQGRMLNLLYRCGEVKSWHLSLQAVPGLIVPR